MKRILKTITVFLLVGPMVIMHSCEEKLPAQKESESGIQPASEIGSFKSGNLVPETIVSVTDCNLNGWERHGAAGALGTILFLNGPAMPPLGNGSVQFNCPDKKFIRIKNNQYVGTLLTSITELSYSTYVQISSSIADNIFIVLQIDINNDGIDDFPVIFNPSYQTGNYVAGIGPDQGETLLNTWQTWNLLSGVWWRGPAPDPDNGGGLFTLSTLIGQYPNATIMNQSPTGPGSIRINGGTPVFAGPFTGYADNFTIGINGVSKTYDFEETTANAGADQTVVYGYGSNCITLNGSASGGVPPYAFSWSPGGSAPTQAITKVCPVTTTTYKLTVTDANGCSRTDEMTVFVNDVRCGNKMDKVKVCHNGHEICISPQAVQAHLKHGDTLGSCY